MNVKSIEVNQADAAYAEGRFTESEGLYRDILTADPTNVRALERLGTIALWRNDLPNAETNLKAAQHNKSWLARRWPKNIQANTRMALALSRTGRIREAAVLLDSAAGPLPFGPFKGLKIRARQLKLFGEEAAYQIEGAPETIIPFVITDPLPVVKVTVNDTKPVNFIIDTGGEGLILDAGFAKEVRAEVVGEVSQEYAGGKKGLTGYGRVDRVKLGDVSIHNVPVSTLNLEHVSSSIFSGMEIKGVIGTGLLMQFLATIDYPKGQLVLRQPTGSSQTVDRILGVNKRDSIFPIWLVETHLIFSEGSVNHLKPGLMFIDTGLADAGFLATKDIFAEAGVAMDWSKSGMSAGGGGMTKGLGVPIAEVALGRGNKAIRKNNLRGIVLEEDLSLFKGTLGFKVCGLISHQFFRDYAVTLDFASMRMILQQQK